MARKRQMKLSAYLVGTGMHAGSWRLEQAHPGASIDIDYYRRLVQTAERGKFDIAFLADSLAINEQSHPNILNRFEPITLIAALAGATSRIGLVATASTSYIEPFNLARLFMSADHISKGRVGWNIVTTRDLSGSTARNFGASTHPELALRYQKAAEFVNVVLGLWDSWEDDAFIFNKETGVVFDPNKLHRIRHKGEFFEVEGPLNIARSPQGHPVLVQAGNSEPGQQFAAQIGEIIFAIKFNFEDARQYYQAFKERIVSFGRNPDDVYILQGISPVIGATEEEARLKLKRLERLLPDDTIMGFLADYFRELDLSRFTPETASKEAGLHTLNAIHPDYRKHQPVIIRENPTLREVYSLIIGSFSGDHLVGTPEKIADTLEKWFLEGAADGFMLMSPALPDGLEEFIDRVVPILQQRGLFKKDYEGTTLREHFGLPVPPNRFSRQTV
ncbi:LLM class flavin-dependent oxidoreductase [Paenibacillus naphthalenovorans]|uniref:LLM class flavin-dependent oxidoreductase n=1 Tax=Paenibacillus naphthalenovorans TaxID=162209 RepID=UPI000890BD5C|nr:LLM class flavin-dependent oxidoreductase [Paenibacillus naphthalenovorans]GCL71142.1 LLM class flavin-dependent oxidoreductase [Paenibacillus naphthalenovorans]SDI02409.1 FMN-dependent oxidoreductase, nitrilotriacetate monooxygenase family [Paenibacillus naphthalenovorans]